MRRAKRLSSLGYALAEGIFSVVLLIAAASKATVLEASGNAPSSLVPGALIVLELFIEWFMAAWLMSGIAQVWCRRAAILLLLVFVAVTAWRLAGGNPDCHCFGAFRVPPLVTLSFDLIMLFALYGFGRAVPGQRPRMDQDARRANSRSLLPLRVSLAVMISIVLPISTAVTERRLLGFETAFQSVIPLDPQSWLGSPLPLLEDMGSQDRADLMAGDRTVIFFSHDCDLCRRYLARRAGALPSDPSAIRRIRLIDVASAEGAGYLSTPFQQVHLNRSVNFLGAVPMEIRLKNGIVEAVRHPE